MNIKQNKKIISLFSSSLIFVLFLFSINSTNAEGNIFNTSNKDADLIDWESIGKKNEKINQEKVKQNINSSNLSIPFIKNNGQFDEEIVYYANTFYGTTYITKTGEIYYNLPKKDQGESIIKETLLNSNQNLNIQGKQKAQTEVNYFIGNDKEKWKTNNETFNLINFGEIYPGIDLKLKAKQKNVEKLFYVKPGVNPDQIKLEISGAQKLTINEIGELELKTELGIIKLTKPIAFQKDENGRKKDIEVGYKLLSKNSYTFELEEYDETKELIIDPLIASTYVGGSGGEYPNDFIIDRNGDIVLTGVTASDDLPTSAGTYKENRVGNNDIFVLKINSGLTQLLAITYAGGTNHDYAYSIREGLTGDYYIGGYTDSSNFPVTSGAYDNSFAGGQRDVYLMKISSDLSSLESATYLGGTLQDYSWNMDIDSNGSIYITGHACSSFHGTFPLTVGAYYTPGSVWGCAAFISKFSADLSVLQASTFLTDSWSEILAIRISKDDKVYVVGDVKTDNCPTTPGAFDETYNGGRETFIAKLTSDLTTLNACTFLGGAGDDYGWDLEFDSHGRLYVTGKTSSIDFPTTPNAYDKDFNGGADDSFVSLFSSDLSDLISSTYIGGNANDSIDGIFVDNFSGNVYVSGVARSDDFPITPNTFDKIHKGGNDFYISRFDSGLESLQGSTFLGGQGNDSIVGRGDKNISMFTNSSGDLFIAGFSASVDFPTPPGAYNRLNSGSNDIVISRISNNLLAPTIQQPQTTYEVDEDAGFLYLNFTLDGYGSGDMNIDWSLTDITTTSGQDYPDQSGTVTVDTLNSLNFQIQIPISDDDMAEGIEEMTLNFTSDYGVFTTDSDKAQVTIIDDETINVTGTLYRSTHTEKTKKGFRKEKQRTVCLFSKHGAVKECDKTNDRGKFSLRAINANKTYYLTSSSKKPITRNYYFERMNLYKKKYQPTFGDLWKKKFKNKYRIKKAKNKGYPYDVKYYRKYKGTKEINTSKDQDVDLYLR